MIDTNSIREHQEVVGSDNRHVGVVDHVDGHTIKLTKNDPDAQGRHHWLALEYVAEVGEKVRLNIPASEAEQQWLETGPLKEIGE